MPQYSLLIPQPWSVPVIEQPRLGSNIRHSPQARQTFSIGLCVCVKGLHCVPPQVSASQFSPPIGQFIQSTTSPGRYRPPDLAVSRSALGPGWFDQLDEARGQFTRRAFHIACVAAVIYN